MSDGPTVLLVDDEPQICNILVRCLGHGYDVTVAHNGAEAMSIFEEGRRFDVVLCDWMMPRMSGSEMLVRLQALAPEQAQRIIVMTGDSDAVSDATAAGFFVLAKPFMVTELRALVERVVRVEGERRENDPERRAPLRRPE